MITSARNKLTQSQFNSQYTSCSGMLHFATFTKIYQETFWCIGGSVISKLFLVDIIYFKTMKTVMQIIKINIININGVKRENLNNSVILILALHFVTSQFNDFQIDCSFKSEKINWYQHFDAEIFIESVGSQISPFQFMRLS